MPPLYSAQQRAFFNPARYAVTEASTKAGKTVGAIVWQATEVLADRLTRNHWWVAPIYKQAEIAFRRARRMFTGICKANESDLKLSFDNGAVWWFKSAEKPDNLYGEDVASVVFDEYTRARHEAWFALRSTITATGGKVRLIGNVRGRGWGYQMARKAEAGEQGWHYARITADDAVRAGVLTKGEIEDAERTLPDYVFRELYYCEPSDDGGNPFGIQHIAACVGELSTDDPIVWGVDLARKVDWTVCVGLDRLGRLCAFDRWQRVPWAETRSRILRLVGETPALVDATGVGDPVVEDMARQAGQIEPFTFTNSSKQQLMEGLVAAIQAREVTYPDGPIKVELEQFEYLQRGGRWYYSAPAGMHDDCVMALGLAVQHLRNLTAGGVYLGVVAAGEHDRLLDDEDRGWHTWD